MDDGGGRGRSFLWVFRVGVRCFEFFFVGVLIFLFYRVVLEDRLDVLGF